MAGKGAKFWGNDDEGSVSGSDAEQQEQEQERAGPRTGAGRGFQIMMDSDSSDDDGGRVVRSKAQREYNSVKVAATKLTQLITVSDYPAMPAALDAAIKAFQKATSVRKPPSPLLRALMQLQDGPLGLSRGQVKKLPRPSSQGVTKVKQAMKKLEATFGPAIAAFRENPVDDEPMAGGGGGGGSGSDSDSSSSGSSSGSSDSDSSSDGEVEVGRAQFTVGARGRSRARSASTDSSSSSGSDDSVRSDDSFDPGRSYGRNYWLLRDDTDSSGDSDSTAASDRRRRRREDEGPAVTIPSYCRNFRRMTLEDIEKRMQTLFANRGRRGAGTDRRQAVDETRDMLFRTRASSEPDAQLRAVPIALQLVSDMVEGGKASKDGTMSHKHWLECAQELWTVMDTLDRHRDVALMTVSGDDMAAAAVAADDDTGVAAVAGTGAAGAVESKEGEEGDWSSKADAGVATRRRRQALQFLEKVEWADGKDRRALLVVGELAVIVEQVAAQFFTGMQLADANKSEYVERLADEMWVVRLAERANDYHRRNGQKALAASMAWLTVYWTHYRHDRSERASRVAFGQQVGLRLAAKRVGGVARAAKRGILPPEPEVAEALRTADAEVKAKSAGAAEEVVLPSRGLDLESEFVDYKGQAEQGLEEAQADARLLGSIRTSLLSELLGAAAASSQPASAAAGAAADVDTEAAARAAAAKSKRLQAAVAEMDAGASRDCERAMHELCRQVYANSRSLAPKALLAQVFHHANHDRFSPARDLMLMSRMQEQVEHMDEETRVLFNRATAMLGVAAFRTGDLEAAHGCLEELCGNANTGPLVAQTLSRWSRQEDPEARAARENAERRRMLPKHMHVPLDILNGAHLISAMLLEVPHKARSAAEGGSSTRKAVSYTVHRLIQNSRTHAFRGPPHDLREYITEASLALLAGDWERAMEQVRSLRMWKLWSRREGAAVLEQVEAQVKEVAMHSFLLNFSPHYDALSHERLMCMFSLPQARVRSVVSKLIVRGGLPALWDEASGAVVLQYQRPTQLQSLALEWADELAGLVCDNEVALDSKTGARGSSHEDGHRRGQRWNGSRHSRRGNYHRRNGGHRAGGRGGDRRRGGDRGARSGKPAWGHQ